MVDKLVRKELRAGVFWYSLEVRLSHELLDLLGGLMLPPLGIGPPANNDDPLVKGK